MKFHVLLVFLIFSYAHANNWMDQGECLFRNESMISSNTCFKVHFLDNGDFVVQNVYTKKVLWRIESKNTETVKACIHEDGNFVIYNSNELPTWISSTQFIPRTKHGKHRTPYVIIGDSGLFNIIIRHESTTSFSEKSRCAPPPIMDFSKMFEEDLKIEFAGFVEELEQIFCDREKIVSKLHKIQSNTEEFRKKNDNLTFQLNQEKTIFDHWTEREINRQNESLDEEINIFDSEKQKVLKVEREIVEFTEKLVENLKLKVELEKLEKLI